MQHRNIMVVGMIIMCSLIAACGGVEEKKNAVVTIGDYAIDQAEYNNLMVAYNVPAKNPAARQAFLDKFIVRKVLLQEAQRQGLDQKKDFLRSVEDFWEQGLLKIVVDTKMKEYAETTIVDDKEIEYAYAKFKETNPDGALPLEEVYDAIKMKLFRTKQEQAFSSWVENLKNRATITVDKKALGVE